MRVLTMVLMAMALLLALYYAVFFLYMATYFPIQPIPLGPELFDERKRFERYMVSRGYRICGEVPLGYGIPFVARFSEIFSEETMCIVFFNLPEPKKDYVIYDPVFEIRFVPVNMEDMNKTYLYHHADGAIGLLTYKMIDAPFREVGKGPTSVVNRYYHLYRHGHRGGDIVVVFSYKPHESGTMPMNITILVDVVVVRAGESNPLPTPPFPPKTSGEYLAIMREVDLELEKIGYEKCGEYVLDLGKNVLNLTYTFDPFEGKACYVKILPRNIAKQEIILTGGKHALHPADLRPVSGVLEERSTSPEFYTSPHGMLLSLKPEYRRGIWPPIPEPYSKTITYNMLIFTTGDLGPQRGEVIYLLFSWKLSPSSRIEEGAGFEVTYDFDLDFEVVEKGVKIW